jgi:hypothetical protein
MGGVHTTDPEPRFSDTAKKKGPNRLPYRDIHDVAKFELIRKYSELIGAVD